MTKTAIKEALEEAPSHSVHLVLTNGDRIRIPHQDYVAFNPKTPELTAYLASGAKRTISMLEIASLDVGPAMPPRKAKA